MPNYINAFDLGPSLGALVDQRNNLNAKTRYTNLLGNQVQNEMASRSTLAELMPRYAQGDTSVLPQIAGADPNAYMSLSKHQADLKAKAFEQQQLQQAQFGRMAVWANDPQKWAATPFAQQGIPFEQRDAVIGQFVGQGDVFEAVNPKVPESIQKLNYLMENPQAMAAQQALNRSGASNTQVQIKQEAEEAKVVGKFYGDEYATFQTGGRKARQANAKLDRLEQLFKTATPGRTAPLANGLKAWAQGFGIDLEAIGVTDTTSEADSIEAITNQMALALRNPAGGEGMPGALSDKDREFLKAAVPGLQKTPGGNAKVIEYMRRMNQRAIQEAAMSREYRRRFGSLDEDFYTLLDEFAEENPVFPEAANAQPQQAVQPAGSLSDMSTEELMRMLTE